MRKMPENAAEAYEVINKLVKKSGKKPSVYCMLRGVAHSTLIRWKDNKNSYRQDVFLKLAGEQS